MHIVFFTFLGTVTQKPTWVTEEDSNSSSISDEPIDIVHEPLEIKSENEASKGETIENVSNFLPGHMIMCSECKKELPKSPWKTFPNQSKYLVTGGLSKPNSALRAFTADFVAL